ncbi:glycosyltransferase family 2 protein [Riemerella anatipestifer]|uniref:glycosyltransferase family 2 protein n=1 Tax=Riemerella anatipestifer TaxID=34085 RepID=UPI0007ECABB4|nr:glycosyltransferase family 2 protein [Riemerella anatipestifer]MCO7330921.1 glycosyltransferase family 2 protein [Riemerella anatipestifer]MCO7350029.1 glycosyltransferase family 2 protein [Riemerella anatipestifer]MCW0491535.1 glycosyltransferase family 2 protein [Riemerella anatipestifer]MDD1548690.1 glycosyltransferase family 2 protein [Riemerella anatipestifer]MDD1549958.1 glycosyltransferase family 2 protein [Riemerella anatipestifer]
MQVSIIIVNYNTYTLLVEAIESVYRYTKDLAFEIIVVDNASPNRDIEQITTVFPEVQLINHSKNAGFGAANNIGAFAAKGKYLFFLNPDTFFLNDALSFYYSFYEQYKKEKIGAVGTVLLDKEGRINASFSMEFLSFYEDIKMGVRRIFSLPQKSQPLLSSEERFHEVAWVSGANLFIDKQVFMGNQGFDENIFMYYEETELQYRLMQKGFKNYIVTGSKIVHLEGGSFDAKLSLGKKKIIDKSKLYYYKGRTPRVVYFLLKKLYFAFTFVHFKRQGFSVKQFKDYVNYVNG